MADVNTNEEEILNDEERQEDAIVEENAEEQQVEEQDQQEEESESQEEEDEPEEAPEKPPSRREQLRIQQLLEKYGNPAESKTPAPRKPAEGFLDYEQELDAPQEIIDRLQADRDRYGSSMLEQATQQVQAAEFRMQLNIDAPRVESKYKFLDKDSNDFNPAVAKAINTMYLAATGFDQSSGSVRNPQVRYSDYVEGIFELASEIADNQVKETSQTIRRQASKTGMRPSGSSSSKLNLNKAPQDMSDQELKAYLDAAFK